jgi:hypothetical protein
LVLEENMKNTSMNTSMIALTVAAAMGFTSAAHAQATGGGGGLIAAGQGIALPTVNATPPPLRVPLNQQILAGISGPANAGLGGLSVAGVSALGLGAIIAVGAISRGGATPGTNR